MDKLPAKKKKQNNMSREELVNLDKNDLINKIIQLQAHNTQLKNIIIKKGTNDSPPYTEINENKFDFQTCHFRRVLLKVMYFGWGYQGLAVQEDTTETIEHHLFHALTKSCLIKNRETSQYHRCGRTDKGVSAFSQVISINIRSKFPPFEQNFPDSINSEMQYCKILNRILPKHIYAVAWMPIPDDKREYSARFDCRKRQYRYYFPRSNLNIAVMKTACTYLIGLKDFRNFCKMDVGNGVTEFFRRIFKADVTPVKDNDQDEETSMYCLEIEGNAFLWHQIRCIMGLLLLIGQGKESPEVIIELLDVEKNSRKPQYSMASDLPLNLFHCSYELEETNQWVYDNSDLKTLILTLQEEWTIHNIKTTMIRDALQHLEKTYKQNNDGDMRNKNGEEKEDDNVLAYTSCLLEGAKAKVYIPILKRNKCSSLEEKIEYYRKKKKI